jgi:hypothetical protein
VPAEQQQRGGHPNHPHPVRTQRIALAAAGLVYALVAAGTTAFTRSANIVTALPIVAVAVLVVARWPLWPRPLRADRSAAPHPWRAWLILFGALVVWELADYAARGSRADHPTLSSMADAVNRYYGLKVVMFFLWLTLGVAIVRMGARRHGSGNEPGRPGPASSAPNAETP